LIAAMVAGAGPAAAGPLAEWLRARRERGENADDGRQDGDDPFGIGGRTQDKPLALPPGAEVRRDLAYGPGERQRIDVYLPPSPRSAPMLFMIHGGAWMIGDKSYSRVVENKVARWLPRGFVFTSMNYRFSDPPDPLGQADDVMAALAFVQRNAPQWGADAGRLVMMGHSAGAHLAALVSADASLRARHGARPWLGTVSLDSAAMDLVGLMEARHARFYDKVFGSDPALWRQASPVARMSPGAPPALVVCSSRREDSCRQAEAFATSARAVGSRAEVLAVDLGHGEINSRLGAAGDLTERVDAFMRSLGMP
jgi:acetyl esterase/lipase